MAAKPPLAHLSRYVAVAALVGLLAACNRPSWDNPVGAYNAIARALQKNDMKTVWSGLSRESQRVLTERAKAISEASGGAVSDKPQAHLFTGSLSSPPVKEIKVVKQEGNSAILSVVPQEGPPREVRMVKEKGEGEPAARWKLDVRDLLTQ